VSELAAEYKAEKDVRRLFDLAMKLEGLPRHASTHAAGVVIGDRRLDDLVPMYRDPRSDMPVTQFDMKYVEAAGLVKFDFLGLKTLSVLKEAERLLAEQGIEVDFSKLHWEDEEVYELLQHGDTVGVFQLESEGMRRTLAPSVRPASATSSRSCRSIGPVRWTTFRCSATARTVVPSSPIRIRCSRRS
jgi:DNA polymerase-3 subunit alpha